MTRKKLTKSEADTMHHIAKVRQCIYDVTHELTWRAESHDASKLVEPELSGYESLQANLADVDYGSEAYYLALRAARDTIAHHYANNTHHPEHWPNGVAGMSLLDVMEMLCDWRAASERTKGGNMAQSLEVNFERFQISEQLQSILINTVRELGWIGNSQKE
jgi:hypothetical protein